MKKRIIDKNILKNNIDEATLIDDTAEQISIVLRMDSILFTDLNRAWKYDIHNSFFYEIDLQESISKLFNGKIINHSFKKDVMGFLPYLDTQQVQDYGNSLYFYSDDLVNNPKLLIEYDGYVKNEQYIDRRVKSAVQFNEKLRNENEVINFNNLIDER